MDTARPRPRIEPATSGQPGRAVLAAAIGRRGAVVLSIALAACGASGCATARLSYLDHDSLAEALAPTPGEASPEASASRPMPGVYADQAPPTDPGPPGGETPVEPSRETARTPQAVSVAPVAAGPLNPPGSDAAATPKADPALARTAAERPEAGISPSMAPAVPPSASTYPIDLPTALRLAESINPEIGEARARIGEALGYQRGARVLLVPTLNAGANYHGHNGNLQRAPGQILSESAQSLYFGGGAGALAANSVTIPAVFINTPLAEAWFEPLAARQLVNASQFDANATANTVLLGVALDYLELHAASGEVRARLRTEAEAAEVARITAAYARTGEGRQADADRARTQWRLFRADVRTAEERLAVASARLCRRLQLDPSTRIEPAGDPLEVFTLVDADSDQEPLIQTALRLRPEIHARSADIGAAEQRFRKEVARPLLPNLWLGFSGGAFGGGSNLVPPLVGQFRGRTDFDVVLYWSLLNFGMGNLAIQKRQATLVGEAGAARARVINQVREEVTAARADVLARREQIAQALRELAAASDGFKLDLDRIRGAAAPPLEALNNLKLLGQARDSFIDAVAAYNQAQFRLFVALGSPPPLTGPTEAHPPAAASAVLAEAPAPELRRPTPAAPPAVSPLTPAAVPGAAASTSAAPTIATATPTPAPAPPSAPAPASAPASAVVRDRDIAEASKPARAPSRPEAGAAPDTLQDQVASLARARQDALKAMGDYDRVQARLLEALTKDGATRDREQLLQQLMSLAEAHRDEMKTRVEYDRALWQIFAKLGKIPDNAPRPSSTAAGARPEAEEGTVPR